MVRDTSIETYRYIQETGILSDQLKLIYNALYEHGPCTAQELLFKAGWDKRKLNSVQTNIPSKLHHLVKFGVAREVGKRVCQVKGRRVLVYDVTKERPVKPTRKRFVKVDPDRLALELYQAIVRGPFNEVHNRLDLVFKTHFRLSWKALLNPGRPRNKDQARQLELDL